MGSSPVAVAGEAASSKASSSLSSDTLIQSTLAGLRVALVRPTPASVHAAKVWLDTLKGQAARHATLALCPRLSVKDRRWHIERGWALLGYLDELLAVFAKVPTAGLATLAPDGSAPRPYLARYAEDAGAFGATLGFAEGLLSRPSKKR